jgi:hypothetical protein
VAFDPETLPPEARDLLAKFPEFEPHEFNDSGANSYVLLGRHNVLQREVALKIYFHTPNEVEHEPALIAAISHENVMKRAFRAHSSHEMLARQIDVGQSCDHVVTFDRLPMSAASGWTSRLSSKGARTVPPGLLVH